MRATKKRAVWEPNLHASKVTYMGTRQTMRLCTKCLRKVKEGMASMKKKAFDKPKVESSVPVPAAI